MAGQSIIGVGYFFHAKEAEKKEGKRHKEFADDFQKKKVDEEDDDFVGFALGCMLLHGLFYLIWPQI